MTIIWRDRVLFGILLLIGAVWTWLSYTTIPKGYSGSFVAPGSFPTTLGVLLMVLSAIGLAGSELKRARNGDSEAINMSGLSQEIWGIGATFGFLIVYAVGMQYLGFLLATVIGVAAFCLIVLRLRSWLLISALSLSLGLGLYLLMNKLLGVYLPAGVFGLGF